MAIKITGGLQRGRLIKTPTQYTSALRPTASRVREALFNIIGPDISGKTILDLFAGVGTLGLEALSRHAKSVTFVEKDSRNVGLIRKNIISLGFDNASFVFKGHLPKALSQVKGNYEMVFLDPPYETDQEHNVLRDENFRRLLSPNALIIIEQSKHSDMFKSDYYLIHRTHEIGDTRLTFLKLCL
ncbi:MAG: 16S rRNA (guanine(966)-N(2))-methyltransferase RsmD [Bdellovibrionales bacterium]|nr:16S rRNA (guanine(966)-N(2))-methyltransferase RsmD [Bdellovibrionales bacterium]